MSQISRILHFQSIIERILRDLEEKERTFETYKVASGSSLRFQTRSIIDFIDFELNRVIRWVFGISVLFLQKIVP
ncbi:hypothetical protein GCK32_012611 [Trichostrongylus colubriformis]|uniref:Uncharacterized protein n=1 Tax=Trichostrongylus colubriformis TaxID=6319 RepID=A0AAN8ISB0_TRICO